jgi:hypothetical protein
MKMLHTWESGDKCYDILDDVEQLLNANEMCHVMRPYQPIQAIEFKGHQGELVRGSIIH